MIRTGLVLAGMAWIIVGVTIALGDHVLSGVGAMCAAAGCFLFAVRVPDEE